MGVPPWSHPFAIGITIQLLGYKKPVIHDDWMTGIPHDFGNLHFIYHYQPLLTTLNHCISSISPSYHISIHLRCVKVNASSSRLISLEPTDAQKTSKKHKHAERDSCIKWWSQKHTPTKIRKITATWPQMNSQRSTICTKLPVNHHRWGHAPGVWRPSPRRWQLPRGAWKMRQLEAWGDFGGGLATDFHGVSRFTNWVNLGNGKIPRVFEMTNCHYYLFICLK